MPDNIRIQKYYQQCENLLKFSGLSWWLIDLEDNPDLFYCNDTMCNTFHLDSTLTAHSVSKTCPIAGDYNQNISIKNSEEALRIFNEYGELRHNTIEEYHNRFPYYDSVLDEVLYFTSRARALVRSCAGQATVLFGIIEPEIASEELYRLASLDGLTGLKNRREFDSQLQFLLNLAKREGSAVSMILCDVDQFKLYNDSLGHYAGDQCLQRIAHSLSESCKRETDLVYRYGGEEFAFLFYGTDIDVGKLASSICRGINDLAIPHSCSKRGIVTVSTGHATLGAGGNFTAKELIEKADKGLYYAKSLGGNREASYFQAIESVKSESAPAVK
ncbi:GGDEF domain-containing protein [Vibrio sp. TBV020]|uniref:GGDEF domain-containing protein n=1 Tax=Vibrio sp. TBV020 TaxID=3137398 RepID=UPI0038CD5088